MLFSDLPAPLMRLKQGLMRHVGGDRVMAQVPAMGPAAILVAVELVLESGTTSVEHIENVLSRLTAAPASPCVETSLPLRDAPLTNTSRYDNLRSLGDAAGSTLEDYHA